MPEGIGREIAVPLAAALFLSFTGAFDLEILPFALRLLYWLAILGIGQFCSLLVRASMDRLQLSPAKLVLAGVVRCVLVSLPITAAVWLVTRMALSQPLDLVRMPDYYFPVLVVTAAMVCINLLAQRKPFETHAASEPREAERPAPLLARLPPKLRAATLYAVQAEDHYIRLFTSAGTDLILLRFSDALGELRGLEGAQVHRSWWVARQAVEASRMEDGKRVLVLRDGTKAPVSRTFARALRAASWF